MAAGICFSGEFPLCQEVLEAVAYDAHALSRQTQGVTRSGSTGTAQNCCSPVGKSCRAFAVRALALSPARRVSVETCTAASQLKTFFVACSCVGLIAFCTQKDSYGEKQAYLRCWDKSRWDSSFLGEPSCMPLFSIGGILSAGPACCSSPARSSPMPCTDRRQERVALMDAGFRGGG